MSPVSSASRQEARAGYRDNPRQATVPQAAEEAGTSASCADHRQAEKLRGGEAGDHARRRASAAQRSQQPGGEFSSTDATTRADHEALQVVAAGAAVPFQP